MTGQKEVAELLIENGADPNVTNNYGATPLHMAIKKKYAKGYAKGLAELLIEHGADLNVKDNEGRTPLKKAVKCRLNEVAELLIERGADMDG